MGLASPSSGPVGRVLRRAVAAAFILGTALHASDAPPDDGWMSLEQLGDIKVVVASKRAEPAWSVGAALSVVTNDDVRFAGVRTLGDALRLAPGLSVAQVDARDWMVGARGFDQQFANKLLVMIDGRTVYTPLFGGVFWDVQDVVLEDLAQIEVVRGPGAALWGANAVNGVVNIVTKSAADTTGTFVSSTVGTAESAGTVRYGAAVAGGWAYRVYARASRFGASRTAAGADAGDAWGRQQTGFRADRTLPDGAQLTVQGDAYVSSGNFVSEGAEFAPPRLSFADAVTGVTASGANLLARWGDADADGAGTRVQAFVDAMWRSQALLAEGRHTADLDFQRTQVAGAQTWAWGAGYRVSWDRTTGRHALAFVPANYTAQLLSGFVQDQIALLPGKLDLVVGTKVEHNDFTGFEVQPGVRLVWRPAEGRVFWAAASRAVRSPTRTESGIVFDAATYPAGALGAGQPATVIRWSGRPAVRSETLLAYEAGWRQRLTPAFSLDATVFYHDYSDLVDIAPKAGPSLAAFGTTSYLLSEWEYRNGGGGASYGAETAFTFQPGPRQRWSAGCTLTRVTQSGLAGGVNEAYFAASTPECAAFARLRLTPVPAFDLEIGLRTASGRDSVEVPAAVVLDARVAWRARPDLEWQLRGENLTDPVHPEFREGLTNRVFQIRRGVYLSATLRR
jgi:iron complex outermembrane receptor protein